MKFYWICTALAAVLATLFLVNAFASHLSAEQLGAAGTISLNIVLIPYVFTRAMQALLPSARGAKEPPPASGFSN